MNIVKVKYYSETTRELSAREYTYYSEEPLAVDDIVNVPVRDSVRKAKVTAVDVPEAEIAAFKDKVKTIPAGAKIEPMIPKIKQENETALIIIKPETDIEVMQFYSQAIQLREYAEARIILTNDDLKPANDDLIVIRKVKKAMEERRKEYLKPFQDHIKETNDTYKKLMEPIEEADKITANKMLAFDAGQKRKIREAEAIEAEKLALARREAELKGGEITIDLTPVEKPEAVPDRIRTGMGSSGQRDNWKWELQDINLVPREYLMINAGMLTPIVKASKGKIIIPGIKVYNEPIIAYHS